VQMDMYSTLERFSKLKAAALTVESRRDLNQLAEAVENIEDPHGSMPRWIALGPTLSELDDRDKEKPSRDWPALFWGKERTGYKLPEPDEELPPPRIRPRQYRPFAHLPPPKEKRDVSDPDSCIAEALEARNRTLQDKRFPLSRFLPRLNEEQAAPPGHRSRKQPKIVRHQWPGPGPDLAQQLRGQFFSDFGDLKSTCGRVLREGTVPAFGLAGQPVPRSCTDTLPRGCSDTMTRGFGMSHRPTGGNRTLSHWRAGQLARMGVSISAPEHFSGARRPTPQGLGVSLSAPELLSTQLHIFPQI